MSATTKFIVWIENQIYFPKTVFFGSHLDLKARFESNHYIKSKNGFIDPKSIRNVVLHIILGLQINKLIFYMKCKNAWRLSRISDRFH